MVILVDYSLARFIYFIVTARSSSWTVVTWVNSDTIYNDSTQKKASLGMSWRAAHPDFWMGRAGLVALHIPIVTSSP